MLLDEGVMRSKCRNMEVWCPGGLIRRFGVLLLLPLLLQVMRNWRSRGEVLWSREGEREMESVYQAVTGSNGRKKKSLANKQN